MPRLTFINTGETLHWDLEDGPFEGIGRRGSLLDAMLARGILLDHVCGGTAACGTCHVVILEGASLLSPIEEDEAERLEMIEERTDQTRLACQCVVRQEGSVVIRIPADGWAGIFG